jgi:hypothetical protein
MIGRQTSLSKLFYSAIAVQKQTQAINKVNNMTEFLCKSRQWSSGYSLPPLLLDNPENNELIPYI